MSDRPGRPPSYHYVRRNLDPEERRPLWMAAAGAAVGVGAIVLYLGRIALARDRVERAPAAPPPPGASRPDEVGPDEVGPDEAGPDEARPDELRPDELRPDAVRGSNGKAAR